MAYKETVRLDECFQSGSSLSETAAGLLSPDDRLPKLQVASCAHVSTTWARQRTAVVGERSVLMATTHSHLSSCAVFPPRFPDRTMRAMMATGSHFAHQFKNEKLFVLGLPGYQIKISVDVHNYMLT